MIVPGAESVSAPASPEPHFTGKGLVDVPKETKLKAGGTQVPRTTGGSGPVIRNFQQQTARKQNPVVKYSLVAVVVVALGVGGWLGWPYLKPHLPFLNDSNAATASNRTTPASPGAEAAAAAQPAPAPAPVKEAPMTPPTYTLEVAQARFTEGKVNGTITGTNFVPDTVRLEKLPGVYVLELRQGAGATPDRGLRVYMKLSSTNTPAGQSWTVSPEMKGTPISHVVKVWKTNPKYAAQEKSFSSGFALKLEFGELTESNTISGKIYAALPDKEQSVVAGVFHATSTLVGAAGAAPAATTPSAVEMSPEFQKRYGSPTRR